MKALLVVDIPDDIFIEDCTIEYRVVEHVMEMCVRDGIKRLIPLPEKAKYTFKKTSMWWGICKGWNACIDEILKYVENGYFYGNRKLRHTHKAKNKK